MAGWLNVDVGTYCQISDSLHVYERHWQELGAIITEPTEVPRNRSDLRIDSYEAWERVWARFVDGAVQLTQLTRTEELTSVADRLADLPPAYAEWLALLTAEALRRRNHGAAARSMIEQAGPFWKASWRQWAEVAPGPRG